MKPIPIGISDYKELIDNGYYYIDKTIFIRDVIENGSKITLLPRPRRFGKTLNLSMLRYFFEKTEGNIYRSLFNNKEIERWNDFEKYQGKYPVVFITLKDCKGETFQKVLEQLSIVLKKEFERHIYLRQNLQGGNAVWFDAIINVTASEMQLRNAVWFLADLLFSYWGTLPLILLDEYDTPIHIAYDKGYYDEMIGFMRNFLSTVFKDNTNIFKGIITGILRISKESIFSGLNNLDVNTMLDVPMCTCFGFTQEETDRLLDDYSLSSHKNEVKNWYNGYLFGGVTIYNPWSLLNYVRKKGELALYWVNTSSDTLLRSLIAEGPSAVRQDMEVLLKEKAIRATINDKLSFPDLEHNVNNIWSFMLFCGYLKAKDKQISNEEGFTYLLEIPNKEINLVFKSIIQSWINRGSFNNKRLEELLRYLITGDIQSFERLLNEFIVSTLSYYDTSGKDVEKVYQAFLLGMLVNLSEYEISSNREAGYGRYDILLRPRNIHKRGIIMELKVCDPTFGDTIEGTLTSALKQIKEKDYVSAFRSAGITDVLELAVTFDGKRVWVKEG